MQHEHRIHDHVKLLKSLCIFVYIFYFYHLLLSMVWSYTEVQSPSIPQLYHWTVEPQSAEAVLPARDSLKSYTNIMNTNYDMVQEFADLVRHSKCKGTCTQFQIWYVIHLFQISHDNWPTEKVSGSLFSCQVQSLFLSSKRKCTVIQGGFSIVEFIKKVCETI